MPGSGADFLRGIARPVPIVPETMHIDTLLAELQTRHVHMAMVVDEYGGIAGMVTFENVIEEIVGQVQDEFDQEAPPVQKVGENDYLVEGKAGIADLNDALSVALPTEDADTVSGLLLAELGRIPKQGDEVVIEGVRFTVHEMRRQRIHQVRVSLV